MKRRLLAWVVVVVLLCFFIMPVTANANATLYVPDDYPTIQAAVDAASPGDTIFVRDGTYTENIDVNTDSLTIQSENGADSTTVQAANPDDPVFEVTADSVAIRGFREYGCRGIHLDGVSHCEISNNIVLTSSYGIYLIFSSDNEIASNSITNSGYGIWLRSSNDNTMIDNSIQNCAIHGIYFQQSDSGYIGNNNILINNDLNDCGFMIRGRTLSDYLNTIDLSNTINEKPICYYVNETGITVPSNAGEVILVNCNSFIISNLDLANAGTGIILAFSNSNSVVDTFAHVIYLDHSNDNLVQSNTFARIEMHSANGNTVFRNALCTTSYGHDLLHGIEVANGIYMEGSCNNNILENSIQESSGNGMLLCYYSDSNNIQHNTLCENSYGITIGPSACANNIENNTIRSSDVGFRIYSQSDNNIIFLNNFIDNNGNISSSDSTNMWQTVEEVTYTYNGNTYTDYLGNYWDDYTGSDADGDGIGELPYSIDSDADNYPLVEPFENYEMYEILEAETIIDQKQDEVGMVTIPISIFRLKEPTTDNTVTGIPIGAYEATALYDPAGIVMLNVLPGDRPFNNPEFYIYADHTEFAQLTASGREPPIVVARLVPRLIGCATHIYELEVTFGSIHTGEAEIPEEESQILYFQRGDIDGNGTVDIIDAMKGAQHLVHIPEAGDINFLNMASIHHDNGRDKKNIIDCMFIAQYLVGLRDCWFERIGP